ncbi:ATP-binding protein [Streptomyces sp. S.PB5]|uniref:ATP-binding protein n=1 Tax=Streptomyces sp. S.PB5 TaxID=3020844 RepID=UPI0025B00202|nr:ATP-binding protein [Streptomyces sp. S.PB5]MDN3021755.1 ATP-binding protein [Streptomyces sp. S.PB5]
MPNDHPRGHPVGGGCTTILGPGRSSVRRARTVVRTWLLEYGLLDPVDTVELLVSELATNAVRHAPGRYRLTLTLDPEAGLLRCAVADEGPDLPPDRPDRPSGTDADTDTDRHTDTDAEGGRGLLLVDALADRWGCERVAGAAAKEVWFELKVEVPCRVTSRCSCARSA